MTAWWCMADSSSWLSLLHSAYAGAHVAYGVAAIIVLAIFMVRLFMGRVSVSGMFDPLWEVLTPGKPTRSSSNVNLEDLRLAPEQIETANVRTAEPPPPPIHKVVP